MWQTLKHSGLVTDFPPEEAPADAWTEGENVQFELGVSQRAPGYARFAEPPQVAPIFALNVVVEAISWWIYCSTNQVWVTDGVSHYNITPAGGLITTAPNEWTGCLINGLPVLNNTHNAPFYWNLNTATPCITLPGWPVGATCKAMRAHKYHLFALSIVDAAESQESTLWWSNGAQPGAIPSEWVPTVSNDAGDMVLADTPGAIVDGLSLRDTFVVYKGGASYMLSYVAGQYVYTQRKLYLAAGLAARNCVVEHAGNHYIFTGSDVMVHDGQNAKSIVVGKVKKRLVQSINSDRQERCFLALRRLSQTLYMAIPVASADMPDTLFSFDLETGDCGVRTVPLTAHIARGIVILGGSNESWDVDSETWDSDVSYWNEQDFSPSDDTLLAAMPDAVALMAMDVKSDADGGPIHARLTKTAITLDHSDIRRVLVRRISLRVEGAAGDTLQVRVGGQAFFGAPITWDTTQTLTIGEVQVLSVQAEGRMIAVDVEGNTLMPWRLHSYKVDVARLGDY